MYYNMVTQTNTRMQHVSSNGLPEIYVLVVILQLYMAAMDMSVIVPIINLIGNLSTDYMSVAIIIKLICVSQTKTRDIVILTGGHFENWRPFMVYPNYFAVNNGNMNQHGALDDAHWSQ